MILVLGGTLDSRQLTDVLIECGKEVCYSALSNIGVEKMSDHPRLTKIWGQLDSGTLRETMVAYDIDLCIDGTHPYAKEISQNAIWVCEAIGVDYIRLERPSSIKFGEKSPSFDNYEEAQNYLLKAMKNTTGNVLLTTGSRFLELFDKLPKSRTYIRVLPTSGVLKKCESLGYQPKNIIGMQGPFSIEMNVGMMKEYNIKFLVTKDSGDVGGVEEKIAGAIQTKTEVIFIRRPEIIYPRVVSSIEEIIKELSLVF
ncbi:MAG: precorrin-6A reductase [Eubacteriaceae bacterium]